MRDPNVIHSHGFQITDKHHNRMDGDVPVTLYRPGLGHVRLDDAKKLLTDLTKAIKSAELLAKA